MEYTSLSFTKKLTFNQFLNPCVINESLLCIIGVQPIEDFKVRQKYDPNTPQSPSLLEAEDTQLNYYAVLKDFLVTSFGGAKSVDVYLESFKPKILDNLFKHGAPLALSKQQANINTSDSIEEQQQQQPQHRDLDDLNDNNGEGYTYIEIPLNIQSVEVIEQIYILCCLLLVTSVRSKNRAWATTNMNYLPFEYKQILGPFNISSRVEEESDDTSSSSSYSYDDEYGHDKRRMRKKDMRVLAEYINSQKEKLKLLEVSKIELETEVKKLKNEQEELKDELNDKIMIIDDLKKSKQMKIPKKSNASSDQLCAFELSLMEGVSKLFTDEVSTKGGGSVASGYPGIGS